MRPWALGLILSVFAVTSARSACAPDRMVRGAVRRTYPMATWIHPDPNEPPDVFYRSGPLHWRFEQGDVTVFIVSPDAWMVGPKSGAHDVIPVSLRPFTEPVVQEHDLSPVFRELEFGCEADFVRARMPEVVERGRINGKPAEIHRLVDGPNGVEIALDRRGRPLRVSYFRTGHLEFVADYEAYEILPFDPKLFEAPKTIAYREGFLTPPKLIPVVPPK